MRANSASKFQPNSPAKLLEILTYEVNKSRGIIVFPSCEMSTQDYIPSHPLVLVTDVGMTGLPCAQLHPLKLGPRFILSP